MNYKTTIALLAIAIFIVLGFTLVKSGWLDGASTDPEEQSILLNADAWKPGQVNEIKLSQLNQPAMTFKQTGPIDSPAWKQVEPVEWSLDLEAVQRLLLIAGNLKQHSNSQENIDPKTVQLDPPMMRVTFNSEKQEDVILELGRQAALGFGWARINNGPVITISDELHQFFNNISLTDFRVRHTPSTEDLNRFIIQQPQGKALILSKSEDQWTTDADPVSGPANQQFIDALSDSLNEIKVGNFIQDNPASLAIYGLSQPTVSIQAFSTASTTPNMTLLVGAPVDLSANSFFAKLDSIDTVFTISAQNVALFNISPEQTRAISLSSVKPEDILHVNLKRKDGFDLTLMKIGNSWGFGQPDPGFNPSLNAFADVLTTLFKDTPSSFTRVPLENIESPFGQIEIEDINGTTEQLYFMPSDSGMILYNAEGLGYVHQASKVQAYFSSLSYFRDRIAFQWNESNTQNIRMTREGQYPAIYQLQPTTTQNGTSWGFPNMDQNAVNRFLSLLKAVKAEQWIIQDNLRPQVFDINITLNTFDGKSIQFLIDSSSNIIQINQSDDSPSIPLFKADPAFIQACMAEWRDKVMLKMAASEITLIERGHVKIERGTSGQPVIRGGGSLDYPAVSRLINTLAGLNALHILPESTPLPTPKTQLIIKTSNDEPIQLDIWAAKENTPPMVRLKDGSLFTISQSTYTALTDELLTR